MALIHHKNASLPHGRTELYERIATAYLEQIDLRRRLDSLPYSLAQKKRWLSEVAYRMQLQRFKKKSSSESSSQILVRSTTVKRWLKTAMKASCAEATTEEADRLLDYFAKRSGLLLPRGENAFAFMHLSLQEYFAACYIEPRLTESRFAAAEEAPDPSDDDLFTWANEEVWRETLVLLFELVSQKSVGDTEGFLEHLFGSRLENDEKARQRIAAGLLAEVATDPLVSLSAATRKKCIGRCWKWALSCKMRGRAFRSENGVIQSLLRASEGDLKRSWKAGAITPDYSRGIFASN